MQRRYGKGSKKRKNVRNFGKVGHHARGGRSAYRRDGLPPAMHGNGPKFKAKQKVVWRTLPRIYAEILPRGEAGIASIDGYCGAR